MGDGRSEILEDEWLVVRHSGEIPEIALHSALYYLGQDPEGPRLILKEQEIGLLRAAAMERFAEIVLRDLNFANASLPIYRGLKRVIYNWQRYQVFCRRQQQNPDGLRDKAAQALRRKLDRVATEPGLKAPFFNCTCLELSALMRDLGLDREPSAHLLALCQPED